MSGSPGQDGAVLDQLDRLFKAWNAEGVEYCHWKSTLHLADTMAGRTDVDVLIGRGCAEAADRLMAEAGFRRFHTVSLRTYPAVADYVALDCSGTWVHLHVHWNLILGDRWTKAYRLPAEDAILENARFEEEYNSFVVHPRDELLLFCARMSLKFSRPFKKPQVREEVAHIVLCCGGASDRPQRWEGALPRLDGMAREWLEAQDCSSFAPGVRASEVAAELRRFRRFGPAGFKLRSWLRCAYRYGIEFNRRVRRRYTAGRRRLPTGGRVVAFVGIDGSGKTSAAARAERLFASQMNVQRVFLGNGRSGASWYRKIAFALLGTRAKLRGHRRASGREGQTGPKTIPWYYALWMLLCMQDKRGNLKRAMGAAANGALVISDRWPQRNAAPSLDGPRLGGGSSAGLLARYAAKQEEELLRNATSLCQPDMIIVLRVSPEVALARKPGELDPEEAAAAASLERNLNWAARKVVTVDADRDVDEVDRDIRNAIWTLVRDG